MIKLNQYILSLFPRLDCLTSGEDLFVSFMAEFVQHSISYRVNNILSNPRNTYRNFFPNDPSLATLNQIYERDNSSVMMRVFEIMEIILPISINPISDILQQTVKTMSNPCNTPLKDFSVIFLGRMREFFQPKWSKLHPSMVISL